MKTETLKQMKKTLILVDMLKGFMEHGNMADPTMSHINAEVVRLTKQFLGEGNEVISIQEGHTKNSIEFKSFPPHCLINDEESELIDPLKIFEPKMKIIRKNSTSGFVTKEFLDYLNQSASQRREFVIVGVCFDICVLNLALPLRNHLNEYNIDIPVTIPENAVETYQAPNHDREQYRMMATKIMEQSGIQLVKRYGE